MGRGKMGERLTVDEMRKKFPGEWLLVEDIETNSHLQLVRGDVTFHNQAREEVEDRARERKPKRYTVIFTGVDAPDMEFLL
jgi:hypothetical protein